MKTGQLNEVIGNTPLIKIQSLSQITGCEVYGKAEFLNPGGSVKDRTALGIILDAEKRQVLKKGMSVVEGTAGNTGIGLAMVCKQRGYKCVIVMPDNQSAEKYQILKALDVELIQVKACAFSDPQHFYHRARQISETSSEFFWANQFENTANYKIHYQTTAAEIWTQTEGQINAFVSAVGTGGTLAGISKYLKEKNNQIHIQLVDPFGSGLFSYFKTGQLASTGSSITEGIGIMRLTANFKEAQIDSAIQVSDQNMINMLYHLARHDGLLVGTSAALNVFAAYQWALQNKDKALKIVTILCDSALRYQSKIFNEAFLAEKNLKVEPLF